MCPLKMYVEKHRFSIKPPLARIVLPDLRSRARAYIYIVYAIEGEEAKTSGFTFRTDRIVRNRDGFLQRIESHLDFQREIHYTCM